MGTPLKPIPVGSVFGRLTVVGSADPFVNTDGSKVPKYLCLCACGGSRITRQDLLRRGDANSCGCLQIKHGNSAGGHVTGTYGSWASMKARCLNPADNAYRFYGAKGIAVCERWMTFEPFLEDMGEKPDGWAIDRIDPKGNYEPENCRWLSISENSRRAVTRSITEDQAADVKARFLLGQKQCDIARHVGQSDALVSQICRGQNWAYTKPAHSFYELRTHGESE
jgi:hypothetical protein